jgi:predicted ATPase
VWLPLSASYLASAYVQLARLDDARRCISEAFTATETTGDEAEINRIAGEIELKSPGRDAAKAEAHFVQALTVARQQQAKSWELRAAMSMARLWRGYEPRRIKYSRRPIGRQRLCLLKDLLHRRVLQVGRIAVFAQ